MEDITPLKTQLLVNDASVPLNEFTQSYIGNILKGIVRALGENGRNVSIYIESDSLRIYTENGEVELKKEFPCSNLITGFGNNY